MSSRRSASRPGGVAATGVIAVGRSPKSRAARPTSWLNRPRIAVTLPRSTGARSAGSWRRWRSADDLRAQPCRELQRRVTRGDRDIERRERPAAELARSVDRRGAPVDRACRALDAHLVADEEHGAVEIRDRDPRVAQPYFRVVEEHAPFDDRIAERAGKRHGHVRPAGGGDRPRERRGNAQVECRVNGGVEANLALAERRVPPRQSRCCRDPPTPTSQPATARRRS